MLQTGDILNCKGNGVIAKLISFFTQSDFTHSAIVVVLGKDVCVLEMQKNGCELKTFDNWVKEYNYQYIAMRSNNYDISTESILDYSGIHGYDFINLLIRQPLKIIKSALTRKNIVLKRERNESERFICSEMVATLYGWENPQNYTPKDIYLRCLKENFDIV